MRLPKYNIGDFQKDEVKYQLKIIPKRKFMKYENSTDFLIINDTSIDNIGIFKTEVEIELLQFDSFNEYS